MKQLAGVHCWWFKVDSDIERKAQMCKGCFQKRQEPPKSMLHPWEYAKGPWQRLHIDFAGPVSGNMYLVIVDSFSKWLEIFPMKKITSNHVINVLSSLFARYGLPFQIVSDNAPQLTSAEFESFLKENAIRHILRLRSHGKSAKAFSTGEKA